MTPCRFMYGGTSIKPGVPSLRLYRDAVFVPKDPATSFADDPSWGLYDSDGVLIDAASYTRGLDRIRVGQSERTPHRPRRLRSISGDAHIYLGPFHFHFGHFLLATLGRFWPFMTPRWRGTRVVYHGQDRPDVMLSVPFARDITRSLDLGAGDFASFDEPVCLREVWVPEPCFEEDLSAFEVYAELAARVGDGIRLHRPASRTRMAKPVYLSKSRLGRGVWRFRNEAELDRCLGDRGVDVVHPETLDLADQIRLFEERDVVLSNAGSALHTTILAREPGKVIGISRSSWVHSSQVMIDRLKRNHALYLDITDGLADLGPDGDFGSNFTLLRPEALADGLLDAVAAIRSSGAVPDPADYGQARFSP